MDGDGVAAALGRDLDVRAFEHGADVFGGVVAFDLLEKYIPHLIVPAEILDLPNQLVFCHGVYLLSSIVRTGFAQQPCEIKI